MDFGLVRIFGGILTKMTSHIAPNSNFVVICGHLVTNFPPIDRLTTRSMCAHVAPHADLVVILHHLIQNWLRLLLDDWNLHIPELLSFFTSHFGAEMNYLEG